MCSLIRLFVQSFVGLLVRRSYLRIVRSFVWLFVYSFMPWFGRLFARLFVCLFYRVCLGSYVRSFVCLFVRLSFEVCLFAASLVGSFVPSWTGTPPPQARVPATTKGRRCGSRRWQELIF